MKADYPVRGLAGRDSTVVTGPSGSRLCLSEGMFPGAAGDRPRAVEGVLMRWRQPGPSPEVGGGGQPLLPPREA